MKDKILFLTFDDGPTPEVTGWVLDLLAGYEAKATFFCIGSNIQKYPGLFLRICEEGHATGNHTFSHSNGWTTGTKQYVEDVRLCAGTMGKYPQTVVRKRPLFRPPYGKIKPSQSARIRMDYKIVMWDVIARDWQLDLTGEDCFRRIATNAGPGSIVVLHDSMKAAPRMKPALEKTLEYFSKAGYKFSSLNDFI